MWVLSIGFALLSALLYTGPAAADDGPTVTIDLEPGTTVGGVRRVTFTGDASSPAGVVAVEVMIKDRERDIWMLPGSHRWSDEVHRFEADLGSPGGATTTWSFRTPRGLDTRALVIGVRAIDADGADASSWVRFESEGRSPEVELDFRSGQAFAGASFIISGSAHDPFGVDKVRVSLRGVDGWLQRDGSFGPDRGFLRADLSARGETSTEWAVGVTVPAGEYDLRVKTIDLLGNFGDNRGIIGLPTIVSDTTGMPIVGHLLGVRETTLSPVTFRGIATDDVAVKRVRIGFKERDGDRWIQADGTLGPGVSKFDAVLSDPGSADTGWSYTAGLPDGRYRLSLRVIDTEGNQSSVSPRPPFTVDTTGPPVSVAFEDGATLLGPDVVLNGKLDAPDARAARISLRDRSSGLWLQPDGSFGETRRMIKTRVTNCHPQVGPACLPGPSHSFPRDDAAWSFTPVLPPGEYIFSIRSFDFLGNWADLRPWVSFTVDPTIDTLPSPIPFAEDTTFVASPVEMSGSAVDDIGVARVMVGIRDRATGLWWDGSAFGTRARRFDAVLSDVGSPSSTWSYSAALPDGSYSLSLRAFDVQGYSASISPWLHFEVDTS